MSSNPMVLCDNLVKIYKTKEIEVFALQGLDLTVEQGEMMAIIGNSGSGKSTLLNILGGLDSPSAGIVEVDGKNLSRISGKQMRQYKAATVGFVWQNTARNLIPYLTAQENVELPMITYGKKDSDYAKSLLEYVGLSAKRKHKLFELSGGEQQRAAIAIAMANRPPLILADEPTGAVDTKTTAEILTLFKRVSTEMGVTVIIVTHDRQTASFVDRVAAIRDGRTSSELIRRHYTEQLSNIDTFVGNTHEELVVLDRVGRLQIPSALLEAAGITPKQKVRVHTEEGKIIIRPDETHENDGGSSN